MTFILPALNTAYRNTCSTFQQCQNWWSLLLPAAAYQVCSSTSSLLLPVTKPSLVPTGYMASTWLKILIARTHCCPQFVCHWAQQDALGLTCPCAVTHTFLLADHSDIYYKLLGRSRTQVERVMTLYCFLLVLRKGRIHYWRALALWQVRPFNFKTQKMITDRKKCCHLHCTVNG